MQPTTVPPAVRRTTVLARVRRVIGADDGFSLIEAVMALVIVVILFVALTPGLVSSFRHVRDNRLHRQATVVALESVEFVRSLTWDELALNPEADALDPLVTVARELDGSQVGLAADEPLVEVSAVPTALVTYEYTETLDGHEFTVNNYVTEVEPTLRRVVVIVNWVASGNDRRHITSTLISQAGSTPP